MLTSWASWHRCDTRATWLAIRPPLQMPLFRLVTAMNCVVLLGLLALAGAQDCALLVSRGYGSVLIQGWVDDSVRVRPWW